MTYTITLSPSGPGKRLPVSWLRPETLRKSMEASFRRQGIRLALRIVTGTITKVYPGGI